MPKIGAAVLSLALLYLAGVQASVPYGGGPVYASAPIMGGMPTVQGAAKGATENVEYECHKVMAPPKPQHQDGVVIVKKDVPAFQRANAAQMKEHCSRIEREIYNKKLRDVTKIVNTPVVSTIPSTQTKKSVSCTPKYDPNAALCYKQKVQHEALNSPVWKVTSVSNASFIIFKNIVVAAVLVEPVPLTLQIDKSEMCTKDHIQGIKPTIAFNQEGSLLYYNKTQKDPSKPSSSDCISRCALKNLGDLGVQINFRVDGADNSCGNVCSVNEQMFMNAKPIIISRDGNGEETSSEESSEATSEQPAVEEEPKKKAKSSKKAKDSSSKSQKRR